MKVREWPFNIVVAQHGLIGYVPEVLSVYRAHPGGIFSKKTLDEQRVILLEIVDSYNRYLDFKFDPEFQEFKKTLAALITQQPPLDSGWRAMVRPFAPPFLVTLFHNIRATSPRTSRRSP